MPFNHFAGRDEESLLNFVKLHLFGGEWVHRVRKMGEIYLKLVLERYCSFKILSSHTQIGEVFREGWSFSRIENLRRIIFIVVMIPFKKAVFSTKSAQRAHQMLQSHVWD